MISLKSSCFPKPPHPNTITLWVRASAYVFWRSTTQSIPLTHTERKKWCKTLLNLFHQIVFQMSLFSYFLLSTIFLLSLSFLHIKVVWGFCFLMSFSNQLSCYHPSCLFPPQVKVIKIFIYMILSLKR